MHFEVGYAIILEHIADVRYAPVAQLDRVTGYEPVGQGFESLPARQKSTIFCEGCRFLLLHYSQFTKKRTAMIKNRKKAFIFIVIAAIALISVILALWGNSSLKITSYEITSPEIPESFDGYRITLVSDLHDVLHGKDK